VGVGSVRVLLIPGLRFQPLRAWSIIGDTVAGWCQPVKSREIPEHCAASAEYSYSSLPVKVILLGHRKSSAKSTRSRVWDVT